MIYAAPFLLCSFGILVAGCAASGESMRVREYVGDEALKVFATATKVEVFRIGSVREHADVRQKLAGYALLAPGREMDKGFARRVAGVVLNDRTYEWDMAKGCIFDPGVAFRVRGEAGSVLVLICFRCDQVGIIVDESTPRPIRIKDADRGRSALRTLARHAFPDDSDFREPDVPTGKDSGQRVSR